RRQAACLQSDDVGDVAPCDRFAPPGQVAGAEDLEVVGRRVAGEGQVLPSLADDFVDDGRRQAGDAEAADGEVVAVANKSAYRVGYGTNLIGQGAGLLGKKC